MRRDYRWMWELPPPMEPGPAYYEGLSLLGGIVAAIVVLLVFGV